LTISSICFASRPSRGVWWLQMASDRSRAFADVVLMSGVASVLLDDSSEGIRILLEGLCAHDFFSADSCK
jgi:hypothetical protein